MSGENFHYWLGADGGDIRMAPSAADSKCIAYLHPREETLCVMEGSAFHLFAMSQLGIARLAAECTKRLLEIEQRDTSPHA